MKQCEFCGTSLSVLIEFDENLECDPFKDKWVCSKCPSSTTFVYNGNNHIGYEYWVATEFNSDGYAIRGYQLYMGFSDKQTYTLEICELRSGKRPRTIYKNKVDYKITPLNAKQKIKTILTFM